MNLIETLADSRRYNMHSHTQFCDGRAVMEDFVVEAVRQGFSHYGFSPHSPIPIDSPCNMKQADVPVYVAEYNRLKTMYSDKIRLYASMEIDYLGDEWGPSSPYFQELPLDYRIGSVHFIPSDYGYIDVDGCFSDFKVKMQRYFHDDIRYVVETFYYQSMCMLEAGGFDVIGHFDKIGHNSAHYRDGIEQEAWYRKLVYDTMDMIVEKGVIVEINTKAWTEHNRMFPGKSWIPYLLQHDVPIIVNSDAHYPHLIDASRDIAFSLLM